VTNLRPIPIVSALIALLLCLAGCASTRPRLIVPDTFEQIAREEFQIARGVVEAVAGPLEMDGNLTIKPVRSITYRPTPYGMAYEYLGKSGELVGNTDAIGGHEGARYLSGQYETFIVKSTTFTEAERSFFNQ
jgi:hypothetical protein